MGEKRQQKSKEEEKFYIRSLQLCVFDMQGGWDEKTLLSRNPNSFGANLRIFCLLFFWKQQISLTISIFDAKEPGEGKNGKHLHE